MSAVIEEVKYALGGSMEQGAPAEHTGGRLGSGWRRSWLSSRHSGDRSELGTPGREDTANSVDVPRTDGKLPAAGCLESREQCESRGGREGLDHRVYVPLEGAWIIS